MPLWPGREWNLLLDLVFTELSYTRLHSDVFVYIQICGNNITLIGVHVNDMGIYASSPQVMTQIKGELTCKFETTFLGPIARIVGFEIERDRSRGTLKIHQQPYLLNVLERFGMEQCNSVTIPADPHVCLIKATDDHKATAFEITKYQSIVGSLMFTAIGTCPDLTYAVL